MQESLVAFETKQILFGGFTLQQALLFRRVIHQKHLNVNRLSVKTGEN